MKNKTTSVAVGMLWTSLGVLLAKGIAFVTQFVLGFLLDTQSYAIFAMVSVATVFVSGLQNSGTGKMLVQRQSQYDELIDDYNTFSLYLGCIGSAVLVVLGWLFSHVYQAPPLIAVTAVTAASIPFNALIALQTARLSIRLNFKAISIIDSVSALIFALAVILSAYLGAQYYSIAVGTVVQSVVKFLIYVFVYGKLELTFHMSLRRFFQILSDLKWLIAGVFLYGLSQQGDYLLLGGMVSAQVLGYYFFGFQLTASVGLLIGMAIGGTLLPVLAKFAGDRAAIHESYLRFGAPMLAISCLLSLGLVGFGPTLIQLIWNGKWDASAYTAAVLAISLPMRILVSASSAAMEAMGLWRTQTLLLIVDAVGLIVAAAVGATLGGLDMIATSVSIQRCLQGLIAAGVAFRAAGASTGSLAEFIGRTLVPFVALSIVLLLLQSLSPSADKLVAVVRGLAMTGAATVIWVFFLWRFDCATLVGLVGLLSRRRSSAGQ